MTWECVGLDLDLNGAAIVSASDAQLVRVLPVCDTGSGVGFFESSRLARLGRVSDGAI